MQDNFRLPDNYYDDPIARGEADYDSHKFGDALAEAAYAIAGHGFTEDEFGDVEFNGWNALVVVSPTILLNLGETELAAMVETPLSGYLVWIREDGNGFVDVVEFASDEGARSGSDLLNASWDAAQAAQNALEGDRP